MPQRSPSTLSVLVEQLVVAVPRSPARIIRFNPKPAGSPRPGSASDAVLRWLREVGGMRTESQIMWATKRSHSSVSWALLYLRQQKLVRAVPDHRNPRYLRYVAERVGAK